MPAKKTRQTVPFMLRLPADLHQRLTQEAAKHDCSLNAEIIERLARPFKVEDSDKKLELAVQRATASAVTEVLRRIDFSGNSTPPSKKEK